ncbi:hypothetical protein [Streptomyces sp. NPDC001530]|uniref:hypothetical protein n=1 Tax=Streptomyces sp. NPDC001530 TaxID=3364582 RepID=UPI0036C05E92
MEGRDGAGRRDTFDLYLISESVPTSASTAQLAAAAARRTTGTRVCEQCGSRPELPCTQVESWLLCQACAHIERLRAAQRQAGEARAHVQRRAARLLDDGDLAVVHVTYTDRGITEAGKRRTPSAAHVTALGADGTVLVDVELRIVSPRSKGIPDGAVDPDQAAEAIRRVLADKTVLVWASDVLKDLIQGLVGLGISWPFPSGYDRRHELRQMVMTWRGDLNPKTGTVRMPIPPGRADRMLYQLQQIAVADGHYLGQAPLEQK